MILGIVNHAKPSWYCHKCLKGHNVLYVKDREHYCPTCVPKDIKDKAIYFNHNRERIEFNERSSED